MNHQEIRQVDAHPAGCATPPPADSIEDVQRQASLIPEPPQRSAEKRRGKKADADDCPHDQILAIWAEVLPSCVQPRAWTGDRRKLLRARWGEEEARQTLEWWRGLFSWISGSDFLMGRACTPGRRPFELTLPWLLRPENFAKTLEGAYSRNGQRRPLSIHDQRSATAAALTGYSAATGPVGSTTHAQRSATIAALTGRVGSGDDILEGHARFVEDEPATGDQQGSDHD